MQFDSIAESSHRSFLQYYQTTLGNHLYKALRYVGFFSVYICITVHLCVFKTKYLKTYTVLILFCFFCTILTQKPTYLRTLNINVIQSGLKWCHAKIVQNSGLHLKDGGISIGNCGHPGIWTVSTDDDHTCELTMPMIYNVVWLSSH